MIFTLNDGRRPLQAPGLPTGVEPMQDPLMASDAGTIVEVGHVVGRVSEVDPGGRYVAVARGGIVTVHDADAGLNAVMSCAPTEPFHQLAVHPGGESIAVLGGEGLTVELWRSDGTVQRLPDREAERDGAADKGRRGSSAFDWAERGWLQFTADGEYLIFGESSPEGRARLHLLDAATLARIDDVSTLQSATGDVLLEDWGEGVVAGCAAAPSTAVAFAACSGDDTVVLAVAEVVEDRLRLYGAVPGQTPLAGGIPGERVMGLALPASGELVVLDSDEFLSAIHLRDPAAGTRCMTSGRWLLRGHDGESLPLLATRYGALGAGDLTIGLNGPLFTRGRLLAMAVEKERRIAGGWDWRTVGLVFLDVQTGQWLDFLELPGTEHHERVLIDNGILYQNGEERTKILRWLPPSEFGA
ncbi:hypothetical protein [Actinomadura sp. B10D3]|uniref:hypothetical protein n=1 Tax=Actinomadura sp. B10D3 TaxID=3153557 RepID=UPI00325E4052